MSVSQEKEYIEQLKLSAKELIGGIGTDNKYGRKIIKLIYGFFRSGFLEYKASKGVYGCGL